MKPRMTSPSGPPVARPSQNVAKTDSRYWLRRVFKLDGSAHYGFRVQTGGKRTKRDPITKEVIEAGVQGRRVKLSTHTGNRELAASRAAQFFADWSALGYDAALERLRPEVGERRKVQEETLRQDRERACTIGEYLDAARAVMGVRPATFACYARALRGIVAAIIGAERTPQRYARGTENPLRAAVDGVGLDILTPEAVQAWRLAFVARSGNDGAASRSARISANSIVRQAKSLFGRRVLKFLPPALHLPDPPPFAGVEFFKRESMRYVSKIDAATLMRQAQDELAERDPAAFLVMLLAVAAGLRRGEIDRLLWRNVDLVGGRIIVEATEAGALKSDDSRGAVDIDARTVDILRGFHARARSPFVVPASASDGASSRAWGNRYRCQAMFERVNSWLRAHAVEGAKPLHTLRKEAGAIIATREGIFAASHFLRHADIAITAAHYADKKTRTVIDMGALLPPENVTSLSSARAGSESDELPTTVSPSKARTRAASTHPQLP